MTADKGEADLNGIRSPWPTPRHHRSGRRRNTFRIREGIPDCQPRMLIEDYIGGHPDQHPDRTLAFAQDVIAAGVDLELVRVPFANHVFNQLAANSLGNQSGRTMRWRFLEAHVRQEIA